MAESLVKAVAHVRVFCLPDTWDACAAFYRDILELPLLDRDENTGFAVFRLEEGPTLSVEKVDPADPEDRELVGRFTGVSFRVNDIEAAYRTLSARGARFDRPPKRMPWGGILAHFRDPAANTSTVVEYTS